jgi:hypothetical protein
MNGNSDLDKIIDDKIPLSMVNNQIMFPKRDMCRDFEYCLFLIKRESVYCVIRSTAKTANIVKIKSFPSRYTKMIVTTIKEAAINENIRE